MNDLDSKNLNRKKKSSKFLNKSDHYVFRKVLAFGLVAACFISISFAALTKPELIKAPFQRLIAIFLPQYDSKTIKKKNNLNLENAAEDANCELLIELGIKGFQAGEDLNLKHSIRMAECFLLRGHNFQAFSMLTPFLESLEEYPESEINQTIKAGIKGRAYITLVLTLIAQLKFKMAYKITRNYCKEWQYSASCVGKLLLMGYAGNKAVKANEAYKLLINLKKTNSKNQSKKGLYLESFTHFAGAISASHISEIEVINQRFYSAINTLQKDNHTLLKMLFYEWTLALFANRQFNTIGGLVDQAIKVAKGQEEGWSYKLKVLKRLSEANQQNTTLKDLLRSIDSKLIFLSDYRMIKILTPLTIRYASAKKLLPIIDLTYRKYKDYKPDPKYLFQIQLLKSRILVASAQYAQASEYLRQSWDTNIKDYVYNHLNGVALLLLGTKSMVQLKQAKAYFELSLKEQLNWQSLYGKAKASIQLKQYREAEKTIRALKRHRVQQLNEKDFWTDMLKAELLFLAKKPKELLRLINKRFAKQEEHPDVLELKASAYYLLGEVKKARKLQDKADMNKVNYTRFFFWNADAPLHPMVFHKAKYGY